MEGRGEKMERFFTYDNRLGIKIPALEREWTFYSEKSSAGYPPNMGIHSGTDSRQKFNLLEKSINQKQAALEDETNFIRSCELNSEIGELASIINDLWIWYRTNEEISKKVHG